MRKGIIFSFVSILLFVSVLYSGTSISMRVNDEKRFVNQEIPARIDWMTYSTVSNDIAKLFGTSIDNSNNITINEVMPKDITGLASNYEQFLYNVYSNYTTSNVSISHKENALYLSNHSKITYGPNKTYFNLTSNETIKYLSLNINASSNTNTITYNWPWTTSGTYIKLMIKDQDGSYKLINGSNSGYVNTSNLHTVNITYNDGKSLRVELRDYLLVNTTSMINTSTTTGLTGDVYTGYKLRIKNQVLEMTKEYNTIVVG